MARVKLSKARFFGRLWLSKIAAG